MFCHGLGCDFSDFEKLTLAMGVNQECYCPRLPKQRLETARFNQPYLLANLAEGVVSQIRDYKEIDLVGHSMGAIVALSVQRLIPQSVRSVTLLEGNLWHHDCGSISRKLSKLDSDKRIFSYLKSFADKGPSWNAWVTNALTYDPSLIRDYARDLVSESDHGKWMQRFNSLKCNTMYIYGDDYEESPTILALKNCKEAFIAGTSHFMHMEKPEACAELVLANARFAS
ncbi:MAG: alpha/beta hydrolase [Pseudomonadota bacterium]